MSEPKRSLKIKLKTGPPKAAPQAPPPRPPAEAPATPSDAMPKKLTLKCGPKTTGSQEPPVSSPQPSATKPKPKAPRKPRVKKEKPARISNPTPKKRALEESTLSDGDGDAQVEQPPPKKLKLKLRTTGPTGVPIPPAPLSAAPLTGGGIKRINFKGITKGKKLKDIRPRGVGYDSEAEDQESDPAIEEDFVLRMLPGENCEYLRQAVAEQRFGPKAQGGADISLRFHRSDGRRATVTVNGQKYAASMVDLPCIVEGMKSWNKREWYKSVDISQMLLVLGPINSEDEALDYPLPKRVLDEKTMQYAHGLTPPMHWVRKNRFRPRINRAAVENVEKEVERLLADDAKAHSSKWSFADVAQLERERAQLIQSAEQEEMEDSDGEDAEGDYDDEQYYALGVDPQVDVEEDEDSLAAELEAELMQGEAQAEAHTETEVAPTPTVFADALTETNAPSPASLAVDTPTVAESPAATPSKGATSGDDDEDSSDEDADADEVDEDVAEKQQELLRQREAIEDLRMALQNQEAELERQQNPILKKKVAGRVQSIKAELESKMAAMGEGAEE